jgi:hypothetical protein
MTSRCWGWGSQSLSLSVWDRCVSPRRVSAGFVHEAEFLSRVWTMCECDTGGSPTGWEPVWSREIILFLQVGWMPNTIFRPEVKKKLNSSLYLIIEVIKHYDKKDWGKLRQSTNILDFGTRLKWVVSFTTRPLYSQGKAPGTHWIGGRVGPRSGLDFMEKRIIPRPCREPNHDRPVYIPDVISTELSRLHDTKVSVLLE